MAYVLHTAMAIDKAVLHRDRCIEVPENVTVHDHWTGVWQEIPDKEQCRQSYVQEKWIEEWRVRCHKCDYRGSLTHVSVEEQLDEEIRRH